MRALIYGYGNPGRKDDGLAIDLIKRLENWTTKQGLHHVDFETNYQLNIEDAYKLSKYDLAVFADATNEAIDSFKITRVEAEITSLSFTMHEVSVSYILKLCNELFNKNPKTYLLHIRGHEWQLDEGLTPMATKSLLDAVQFMQRTFSMENEWIVKSLEKNAELINIVY